MLFSPRELVPGVELRVVRLADAPALAAAYVRNRAHLAPWDPERPEEFFTAEWHDADIPAQLSSCAAGTALPLVLVRGADIVGRVNLSSIVRGPLQSAVLGYWVDAREQGRGVVTAAVRDVTAFARDNLALHRLEAGTLVHNQASQRVLEKAGFEYYGLAPKLLRIAGVWQDHKLFQLILHD